MKMIKRFTAIMLMAVMFCQSTGCFVFAREVVNNGREIHMSLDNLKPQDKEFLAKLQQMFGEFKLEDNKLVLKSSLSDLQNKYNLTKYDLTMLQKITNISTEPEIFSENIFFEDMKVYFDHADVVGLLLAAANAGPAAMLALILSMSTISLGPVGTIIAGALGVIGAPGLANFCYCVIQAGMSTNQGVYLGVEMNGIFPNIVSGTW